MISISYIIEFQGWKERVAGSERFKMIFHILF
jgi:hypothetical protein